MAMVLQVQAQNLVILIIKDKVFPLNHIPFFCNAELTSFHSSSSFLMEHLRIDDISLNMFYRTRYHQSMVNWNQAPYKLIYYVYYEIKLCGISMASCIFSFKQSATKNGHQYSYYQVLRKCQNYKRISLAITIKS